MRCTALLAAGAALGSGCGEHAPTPALQTPAPPAQAGLGAPACRAPAGDPVAAAVHAIGRRIYAQEVRSQAVSDAAARVSSDARLETAVAAHDAAGARTEILALERGSHISRLQVSGRTGPLAEAGVPDVLAPVRGVLRDRAGHPIGGFVLSLQDDIGYVRLAGRITGAEVLVRAGGRQLRGSVTPGPAQLAQGPLIYHGRAYTAVSVAAQAFPTGPLTLWLLVPRSGTPRTDCGQAFADTVALVAARVYRQNQIGEQARSAVRRAQRDGALAAAVARGDKGAAHAELLRLLHPPAARLQVTRNGQVLARAGRGAALGPVVGPLQDPGGRAVGTVAAAVQADAAYGAQVARLTGARVLVRGARRVLGGTLSADAAAVGARGPVRYRGHDYIASSFEASAFPAGRVRVIVLVFARSAGGPAPH